MHLKFTQSYDKNVRAGMALECTLTHSEECSYGELLSDAPTQALTETSHPQLHYNGDVTLYSTPMTEICRLLFNVLDLLITLLCL